MGHIYWSLMYLGKSEESSDRLTGKNVAKLVTDESYS